ncbi:uncharacterized protein LOC142978967 [Anticarsia gemmatalis]|uniref:uncharacterized protein LOC142978967 n=1 Tax=Anticarsia gemmatalis TaxID=129554 RepID=UPI003F76C357
MEVGAVKQAFNNEVILLKKKLNQAKIQIIHKLTRKAKQLVEKKAPDPLKEKLKRKAESAVNEVLIIKKIKPKDIAKFIVTHKGELKDFLNKPQVDNDKACARLLLHKALQDKYKFIRARFSNVPIKDLFMSRIERKKLKKEEKEKQKNKKKGKDAKVVNSEGDWNVEDVGDKAIISDGDDDESLSDEEQEELESEEEIEAQNNEINYSNAEESETELQEENDHSEGESEDNEEVNEQEDSESGNSEPEAEEIEPVKPASKIKAAVKDLPKQELTIKPREIKKNPVKKPKDLHKNKNLNEKLQQRKFKKDSDEPVAASKIVDPFFITATGENYMSVFEPRGPDEVKEEHKQGNRKLRRAVMFGHAPRPKPRRDNYSNNNENGNFRNNRFNNSDDGNHFRNKFNNRQDFNDKKNFSNDRKGFGDRKGFSNDFNDRKRFNGKGNDEKPEKLHPSWEAKKKKSGILPFEGKKIVFD